MLTIQYSHKVYSILLNTISQFKQMYNSWYSALVRSLIFVEEEWTDNTSDLLWQVQYIYIYHTCIVTICGHKRVWSPISLIKQVVLQLPLL